MGYVPSNVLSNAPPRRRRSWKLPKVAFLPEETEEQKRARGLRPDLLALFRKSPAQARREAMLEKEKRQKKLRARALRSARSRARDAEESERIAAEVARRKESFAKEKAEREKESADKQAEFDLRMEAQREQIEAIGGRTAANSRAACASRWR